MPIGEIFITAFVRILFDKILIDKILFGKILIEELASSNLIIAGRKEVLKKITKWSVMLKKINAVMCDAEDKQGNNQAVKIWLEELQDLAYDLDDVLDEFATEQIEPGLISDQSRSFKRKVKAILPDLIFNSNMTTKINEISTRLESITTEMKSLNLNNTTMTSSNKPTTQRIPSISIIDEPKVCGRGTEIKEISELLLGDGESSQGNENIVVIPIVGLGGIGKTTVAQAVYDDENVKKCFSLRAWVCVSDDFDVMRIAKTILEFTSEKCDSNDFNQVQNKLQKGLAGKKVLIVLDDVWQKQNDFERAWSVLKAPFRDVARGSKVVVTTRDTNVALQMGSSKHQLHILQNLPFDDCWSLFEQHAFKNRNMEENLNMVKIGKKIVEKCKGLPLSVRVIGGLLRSKESEDEWQDVLDSELWEDNEILPYLWLSYHHLPSHLKPCFAYCSIFPKDYAFGIEELVLLWIAEGLIQKKEKNPLENSGRDYFNELVSRSLFQLSTTGGNTELYLMHDMINDLASQISGDLCFRLEDNPSDEESIRNLRRARYLSICQGEYDGVKKFERIFEAKCLRTFLPFSLKNEGCYLASNVPFTLFPKMRYLRSLSLKNYNVIDLPDSIGKMKHIRYLDLSFTQIEIVPDWVVKLYNLQTLILRKCTKLKNLPRNFGNLTKLRYFDVTGADCLVEMPLGIGRMKNLHMLSNFIVTNGNGSRMGELAELNHIGGTLCISGLHYVIDRADANGACLRKKKNLSKLIMLYDTKSDEILNEGDQGEVLQMLEPHNNLKELHIRGYRGTGFPTWLKDPLFPNMVHIKIEHCSNCSVLPSFGQLKSLKKLYINEMSSVRQVIREFYGPLSEQPFPSLDTLSFYNMPEWEDWFAFGVEDQVQPFGHVKNLNLNNCPKLLGKLPTKLPSLEVLNITCCKKLVVKLDGRVYPSLASVYVDRVELPFTPQTINYEKNTHESTSFSSLVTKILNSVKIAPFLVYLPEWLRVFLTPHESTNMDGSFQYLNSVEINRVPKLVYLPKWLPQALTSLKTLRINSCEELETLLDNSNSEVMQFPVLEEVEIRWCRELVSLCSEEMDGQSGSQGDSIAVQSFMKSLKRLTIEHCDKLEKLPQGLYMLTCLVELSIDGCPNLVSFPETGFPPSLVKLSLAGCQALKRVERMDMLTCLVELSIEWCPNLVSFPETGFPSTLIKLSIRYCEALESPLPRWNSDHNLETLYVDSCRSLTRLVSSSSSNSNNNNNSNRYGGLPSSLKSLEIESCEKLEALFAGEEENRIHCPSLEYMSISFCTRLKYLPDTRSDDSLGKLEELSLFECGEVEYLQLPDGWVRAVTNLSYISLVSERIVSSYVLKETTTVGGFLFTNLHTLHLSNVTVGVQPSEWGLHRMSSLRKLSLKGPIRGEEEEVKVSVFPLDGMLLPTSLTELYIGGFRELERLIHSKGFDCLTSLQQLSLWNCERLAYLPEEGGLPDTLQILWIQNCPILEKKCEKGKGEYHRSILSRIPCYIR